jgi:hypothetical protein
MNGLTTLEHLQRAEARLAGKRLEYNFSKWTSCTCGHIYAGVHGRKSRSEDKAMDATPKSAYDEALRLVAEATFKRIQRDGIFIPSHWIEAWERPNLDNASRVSTLTRIVSQASQIKLPDVPDINRDRAAALQMVRWAIEDLEVRYEADRQAVLDGAARIVDAELIRVAQENVRDIEPSLA